MRNFFYLLMTDALNGPVVAPFKFILYLLSLVYGAAIMVRRLLYRLKIFRSRKVPLKVVSVGNLTLGGTGKTPFVIALAGILEGELKKNTAVLIRGYGWDEQAMLKRRLPDVPILVGEDRVSSAHKAIRLYGTQFAVLDDGFQHWEMARDLNIVLIDSHNPFGNGCLFPRGVLREPKSALARADIIVFTKADRKTAGLDAVRSFLRTVKGDIAFLEAVHRPRHLYNIRERKERNLSFLAGKKAMLVSSIGDPSYFEDTVKDLKAIVVEHMKFADHHDYTPSDMERIRARCDERAFDCIVTTEKDAVKFSRLCLSFGAYTVLTLVIDMEIVSGKEQLLDRLRSIRSS